MALSVLRASPHSGLDELVAANPGYHIAPSGKIYSDHCSVQELRTMRRRINREFFTFRRILHLAGKGLQCGQPRLFTNLLLRTPKIAWSSIIHARRRAKLHR